MPSLCEHRGQRRWRGSVMVGGVTRKKWFPDDSKKTERTAILWEEETRKKLEKTMKTLTLSDSCLSLHSWATEYLKEHQMRLSKSTFYEKTVVFRRLFSFIPATTPVENLTTQTAKDFLALQARERTCGCANRDRKNLVAAWTWASRFVEDFPSFNPFVPVAKYPETRKDRYIPPQEDFEKVLAVATGQDRVMLLTFLFLAARRGEVFQLRWEDIDFAAGSVRICTRKRKGGGREVDYLPLVDELRQGLLKLWESRKNTRPEVFTVQESDYSVTAPYVGQPFNERKRWMKTLCRRAGVKHFGLHAIRHLTATMLFHQGHPVATIQALLRHKSAATTEIYLKRLGLTSLQSVMDDFAVKRQGKVLPMVKKNGLQAAS